MTYHLPDAPAVRFAELESWPESETKMPVCPVCGEKCDQVYKDTYGEVIGCEACVSLVDAWEIDECQLA